MLTKQKRVVFQFRLTEFAFLTYGASEEGMAHTYLFQFRLTEFAFLTEVSSMARTFGGVFQFRLTEFAFLTPAAVVLQIPTTSFNSVLRNLLF